MTRSELKQLIRETIEEISADTALRAAQAARHLGRDNQASRFDAAAIRKREEKVKAVVGDPSISSIVIDGKERTGLEISDISKKADGTEFVRVSTEFGQPVIDLVDGDPFVKGYGSRDVDIAVDRASRMKLIKAFRSVGININANKINIID
jgi:hypothetical protein